MRVGTYGLGTAKRGPAGIGGGGLVGMGADQQTLATKMVGNAAAEETRRNIANQQLEQQEEAGNVALGSSLGAAGGMAIGGPVGMAVGAVVGAIAGGLF